MLHKFDFTNLHLLTNHFIMKKKLLSAFLLLMIAMATFAQERTVSGTVTGRDDGLPIPGVSIKVKGTTTGTQSGPNGRFSINVSGANPVLVFSFIGYTTQEASASGSTVNVALAVDNQQLSEIIVTALGVTREQKSLGYSVGKVDSEALTVAKSNDLSSSLAGKVAGVQLQGSPSSTFDNANIIVRGINGLGVGNPLYIVDGTPTLQENVIMDNVDNISVLKGAAATALYGNRAANGVIVITSKKGARNAAPKIEANLSTSFENVSLLPEYQNDYAGGYSSASTSPGSTYDNQGFYIFRFNPATHPASWASFNGQRIIDYGADESWGPKIAGDMYRPYTSWYAGPDFGKLSPLTPQPNNVKDFFQTGTTLNNSLAFSGGTENLTYRISYGNINRSLVIENAKRDQHQIGINGVYDISKKFSVNTNMMFTTYGTRGKPGEGYALDGSNVTQNFNQWFQRQLNIDEMRNYRNADNTLRSWNIGDPNSTGDPSLYLQPQYWDSPWFIVNENFSTDRRNRIAGNLGLSYKLTDWLSADVAARMSYNNGKGDARVAFGGLQQNAYSTYQLTNTEMNYEAGLNFKKVFGDVSLDGMIGGNVRNNKNDQLKNDTNGGLTFPDYFDITASVARPTVKRTYDEKEVRSVFGRASFGYKGWLYVDGTLRNDWSSALPETNNSYLYPSISTSVVFSELIKSSSISDWLSFGKIRAAFAQVGSDLDPYQVQIAINNGNIYDGNPSAEMGNQFRTGAIRPALTKSYELGTEMRFFNRVGLDFTYYVDNNTDQILGLNVASSSGFTTAQINAGNIQRKGIEISLTGEPIKGTNFNWETAINFAKSESIIKELAPGLNTYLYETQRNDYRVENRVGEKWGQIIGRKWTRNAAGLPVFTSSTGNVISYTPNNPLGKSIVPDFTGGLFNTFRYKGAELSFSMDFQKGGYFYSLTKMYGEGSGLFSSTVGVNDKGNDIRMFPSLGGGVRVDGVTSAGVAVTAYQPARSYFYTNAQRNTENVLLSKSYIKLREVRLGYNLPSKLISSTPIKTANIGAIVGNAWLIHAPAKEFGIDPSELEVYGREGGQLSSSRSIGLNLRLGF